MFIVFELPATAKAAEAMCDALADQAVEVMHPTNRRRLGQRRTYLNACYDQLSAKANLEANKGSKAWQLIASRVTKDKKILVVCKEQMQADNITIW